MLRVEQLAPADPSRLRIEHRRRLRRHLLDDAQDAARRPQLQVQLVEELVTGLEAHGPEAGHEAGRTQRRQLVQQGGLGLLGAGGDQLHGDSGRNLWQSAAREYNDAPRRAIPSGW